MDIRRLLSIAVLVSVVAAAVMIAPAGASSLYCQDGSLWECSLVDGTMQCEVVGQCESEGEEEEGSSSCTPGDQWATRICKESGLHECVYQCAEDGTSWEDLGCSWVLPVCEHDEWCYWDGETLEGGCWEIPGNETPCEDMDWGTSGIQCAGEYGLDVSVSVPCQRVGRMPYPRGMVIVPNRLWITSRSPAWNESWSETLDYNACLSHNLADGDRAIRNYRIGLAWERMDTLPYWEIEDSGSYRGWEVRNVVWERSSWGKPRCGPSQTPGELLPSYRGRVYTYWTAHWRIQYERQSTTTECVYAWQCDHGQSVAAQCDVDGDGVNDPCYVPNEVICDDDENDDGIPDDHCWETEDTGWTPFDLRIFGHPTSYFISSAAGPAPTELEPNPPCNGLCIPVIEVQGLIQNPRER